MSHFMRFEFIRSHKAMELGIENSLPEGLEGALSFTMAGAERVRAALGAPMEVTSGYRCPALNAAVQGSPTSQHMKAEALDFKCPGFGDPEKIAQKLIRMMPLLGIDQLILEQVWVHVSFTLTPRYQALRNAGGRFEPLAVELKFKRLPV